MKNLLFTLISIICFISPLKADLGACVVYQAKFYLKDGRVFNGCFEHAGYETWLDEEGKNEFCSDEGVFTLFKQLQRQRARGHQNSESNDQKWPLTIYKSLEAIPLRSVSGKKRSTFQGYGFTTMTDIVLVDSSEIEQLIFWKAEYTEREWLTSQIHKSTKGFMDTLRNKQFWNHTYLDMETDGKDTFLFSDEHPMYGYHFINYNHQINTKELQRLIRLKLKVVQKPSLFYDAYKRDIGIESAAMISNNVSRLMREAYQQKLDEIHQWFRKKGVVMIGVNDTC